MNCYYLITTEYEKEDTRYLLFRRNAELGLAIQEATKSVLKKAGIVNEKDFKIKKEGIYISRKFISEHEEIKSSLPKDDNSEWVMLQQSSEIMLEVKRERSKSAIQFDLENPHRIDLALYVYPKEEDKIGWGMNRDKTILIACEGECKELKKFLVEKREFNKALKTLEYENLNFGFDFL